jgi:hypothetical protein
MKKILIIASLFFVSIRLNSQIEKKISYERFDTNMYLITSVSNKAKGSGKEGYVSFIDENLINNQFLSIINEVLPKEKQDLLQLTSSYYITFNSKGEVLNCKFFINKNDLSVLTEKDFENLYIRFMRLRIDMSNVRMGSNDYTQTIGFLAPKDKRDRRIKEVQEQRRLKNH